MPPQWRCSHRQSAKVSSMCLRAKDHLEDTKVAVFPRYCAPQKVQTGSAAAGGHRGVATRKATGDLATRRGAGDPETADGGIRTECTRRGHLSRRSLSNCTNLRAGELSEALPPAQPLQRLRTFFMKSRRSLLATSSRQLLLRFFGFADPNSVKLTIHDEVLRKSVGCDPAAVTHHVDFCSQRLQKLIDRGLFTRLRAVLATVTSRQV